MTNWNRAGVRMLAPLAVVVAAAAAASAAADTAPPFTADQAAKIFGALETVQDISLSPDGKRFAYISPAADRASAVIVAAVDGEAKAVAAADGKPLRLVDCGWSAADRLVCREYGITDVAGRLLSFTRLVAFDDTGGHVVALGRRSSGEALRLSQYDGAIIDWMSGADGTVLMTRDVVPEMSTGTHLAQKGDGLGVERVDTRTLRAERVEAPRHSAERYISDGRGNVRIVGINGVSDEYGTMTGRTTYLFRAAGGHGGWIRLCDDDADRNGIEPIAVDPNLDVAYVLKRLDGRRALYRLSLDGKATLTLAYAHPQVDVDDVVQVGRTARVIGATYATEQRHTTYFDPAYTKLAAQLSKAIPGLPLISFAGASADESILLIRASSDVVPGRYLVLDRAKMQMHEVAVERPALAGTALAPVKPVTFRAADGTAIPAYLTLPRGGDKGLPAIVLPHGGPAARDEWGFDWLAQYYAARGYAVLQPEFRGSAGFGDSWFVKNGFQSWRVAIGDVAAAGRWLVSSGIADPARLAIVGWSYGGYAALQTAATEPDLFKAVVAIAPVTDLAMLREQQANFTNSAVASRFIGSGPEAIAGSPLQHAAAIKVPVMMFHGDKDVNVAIGQSRAMQSALTRAGGKSGLVVYAGLDHQLMDGATRADMLSRSDAFLRRTMKMP